jgi:hypothetical protein
MPYKSGLKPRFSELNPSNLINIFQRTLFIFKGDSRRPRISILAKISPISQHHYIKIRALKSNSTPPRGSAWETCIAGPTQRRNEVARRERAKSREEEKDGW